MTFSSDKFKNDRRFTDIDVNMLSRLAVSLPILSRVFPRATREKDLLAFNKGSLRDNGLYFFGHSSSVLMEQSLGMPTDSISRTYKWPGLYSKLDPIDLEKQLAKVKNSALLYAKIRSGDTGSLSHETIQTALRDGPDDYERVGAMNNVLVQMNPELEAARRAAFVARDKSPQGLYGEVHFLSGAMFRKHPDDIEHFVRDACGLLTREESEQQRAISERVHDLVQPYLPPDVGGGWIMSPTVADRVSKRVVELKLQNAVPSPKSYWAQQPVLTDVSTGVLGKIRRILGRTPARSTLGEARVRPGYEVDAALTQGRPPVAGAAQDVSALFGLDQRNPEDKALVQYLEGFTARREFEPAPEDFANTATAPSLS